MSKFNGNLAIIKTVASSKDDRASLRSFAKVQAQLKAQAVKAKVQDVKDRVADIHPVAKGVAGGVAVGAGVGIGAALLNKVIMDAYESGEMAEMAGRQQGGVQ